MIYLNSNRLRMEFAEPGEAPNTGFRFDRAGFITEVVLDGEMRFCASEPQNLRHPSSKGRGFCNEFRFAICEDVPIGEYFPKFGIGLIRKEEDGRFVFYKKYQQVKPFPIKIEHTLDSAVFLTEPIECQGYALRTVKTVKVWENTLVMTVQAENVGQKSLFLEEFCHNFISIDGMAIGSDYQLELPQGPYLGYSRLHNRSGGRPGSMRGDGKGLTLCEYSAIDTDFAIDTQDIEETIPFHWKMTHKGARASVACDEGFKPYKIAIWAVDHMLCPEIVHGFTLEVGEIHRWTRKWTFDNDIQDNGGLL